MADLLKLYGDCFKQSNKALVRGWRVIPGAIGLWLLFAIIATPVSHLGVIGGFILGLLMIAELTLLYGWLKDVHDHRTLHFKDMIRIEYSLFSSILSVAFLLWIVDIAFSGFQLGPENNWVFPMIKLILFLALNPVPEAIYVGGYESFGAIQRAFHVATKASLEWFLPWAIVLSPIILIDFSSLPIIFSRADPLLPITPLLQIANYVHIGSDFITSIGIVILGVYLFFFRAALFERLEKRVEV